MTAAGRTVEVPASWLGFLVGFVIGQSLTICFLSAAVWRALRP